MSGYALGIFWDFDPAFTGLDLPSNKKLIFVRDPLDVVAASLSATEDAKEGFSAEGHQTCTYVKSQITGGFSIWFGRQPWSKLHVDIDGSLPSAGRPRT